MNTFIKTLKLNNGKLFIKTSNLNYFLFQIIIVFIYFDGIRSNLIGGNILTLSREGSIFYLVFYTFYKKHCS